MIFGPVPNMLSWLWQAFHRFDGDLFDNVSGAGASDGGNAETFAKLRLVRDGLGTQTGNASRTAAASRALDRLERQLRCPPRVALLGEINTGASLARLLLGGAMPPPGVTPEMRVPVIFRYGDQPALFIITTTGERRAVARGTIPPALTELVLLIEARLPRQLLRRFEIVDVPGTAGPNGGLSEIPRYITRNVHFALWCTPATQAWKGSEQRAWLALPRRLRATSLLVATHMDRLQQSDREKVLQRLRREAKDYFSGVGLISTTQRALTIEENASDREIARRQGASTELWYSNGGAAFWPKLMASFSAVATGREQSALRVAHRIAAWAVMPVAAREPSGARPALMELWARRTETMLPHITAKLVSDDAALVWFARELTGFSLDVLRPRLEQHVKPRAAEEIAALFLCDPQMLAMLLDGLQGSPAALRLTGLLRQLGEELDEALAAV